MHHRSTPLLPSQRPAVLFLSIALAILNLVSASLLLLGHSNSVSCGAVDALERDHSGSFPMAHELQYISVILNRLTRLTRFHSSLAFDVLACLPYGIYDSHGHVHVIGVVTGIAEGFRSDALSKNSRPCAVRWILTSAI